MIKRLINKCFDILGYKIVSKGQYQEIQHTIRNPEEQMGFFPLDYVRCFYLKQIKSQRHCLQFVNRGKGNE